ncbi:MAG: 4-hydroxy-tetrahydrodipicolinate synthase [Epulopiscium sp. Nuni2H_MBin001]|nr:MAG: 4-hydroxy-tetrahydrodipicolinate synthase [Epulopiscium sp. Nuni2H_MBin001]
MKQTLFTGTGVAIITPFTQTGIDFDKLEKLLEFQIDNKTDSIIICGTTGETPTMTPKEQIEAINFTVKTVGGRIPVIAGAGSNNTNGAVNASKAAQEAGADAILSVVPYYNKPTQRGMHAHFEAVANAVDIPIVLYNVPGRTVASLTVDTIKSLAEIDNIVAIKECVLSQVAELVRVCPSDFSVYTGDDPVFLPTLAYGGKGLISVMANVIPYDTHMIYEHFINGDIDKARELQLKALPLIRALFIESNPAPTKAALNMMGMEVGQCRLPLVPMEQANLEILTTVLADYGLI